jgi:thiamine biosynthesis lipoprotein
MEIERVDRKLNTRNENSILYKLNENPLEAVEVDEETLYLLKEAEKTYKMSGGKYDISIAPLMELWGFSEASRPEVPKLADIKTAQDLVNYEDLLVEGNKIRLSKKGQKLDTGSFLKGYAIFRAKEVLKSAGIKSAFISSISSIETIGVKIGEPWKIGVQNPESPSEILKVLKIEDKAMGVSGDYQTYVEIAGEKYHHILDKNTGFPVKDKKMVVVVAQNAFFSDMLSTAFFGMDTKTVLEIVEKIEGVEVLVVDSSMNLHYSNGMKKYMDI